MNVATLILSVLIATCSWYGEDFHGNYTANGEIYDMHEMTVASPHLPFGKRLLLSKGDSFVVVRVNDRGPFCFAALEEGRLEPHPTRDLDLSKAAFKALAPLSKGIIDVKVREYHVPPPVYVAPPGREWDHSGH